ncbi:isopentenyl phosphate kinase [Halospeciosus flavus]|uniref:Isopentenyl phosphate kinase n=1 Tax=Halospeciosus flavus TaxID=3032283 RepID=A0ABD5Z2P3_9EURY|nr:isopentenyl phosphate kinase [Halospeciosus flavus]
MSRVVLKLGGSVVTEKDEPETVDTEALERVATAIGEWYTDERAAGTDLLVVHGGGSFGHHHAAAHGVSRETGSTDTQAVRDIHGAMQDLNEAVVGALADADVPAVPVHPFSAGYRTPEGLLFYPAEPTASMLSEGFVPVLHGDVVAHAGEGATILSGDELVVELAEGLGATRVGLCSTVPGVLDDADEVISEIVDYEDVADYLGESESTDVTGGMAAKVRALLGLRAAASVFGPDDVGPFLRGEEPGTVIRGE